jgi:hypothetical protein
MDILLMTLIIGAFVALLFLNLYFRLKVFGIYKILVNNRIDIKPADLLQTKKLRDEVVPRYPAFEKEILAFSRHIRYSVNIAILLIVLITAFGAVLMYFRE